MEQKKYVISCCSTADLTEEHFQDRDIHYISFHFTLGDTQYLDDLGKSISPEDFYQAMRENVPTKTSQVNVAEFTEYFMPFLEEGYDILHVSLSSGISGVFNAANIARETLLEQYPDRKLLVVDSLAASAGYGLLMDRLADLRDEGMELEELYSWTEENKLRLHHWFFSTTLEYFVRGGRISKASGWFGTALNICPLLNINDKGELIPRYKLRGKRKVISAAAKKMEEFAEDGKEYCRKCYISHSDCYEDARAVADLVEEAFPKLDGGVKIYNIGTTIGSHTGPGTVALFFWGEPRQD